eukprot:6188432-Pleurochrysis_carterae.AAC.3
MPRVAGSLAAGAIEDYFSKGAAALLVTCRDHAVLFLGQDAENLGVTSASTSIESRECLFHPLHVSAFDEQRSSV